MNTSEFLVLYAVAVAALESWRRRRILRDPLREHRPGAGQPVDAVAPHHRGHSRFALGGCVRPQGGTSRTGRVAKSRNHTRPRRQTGLETEIMLKHENMEFAVVPLTNRIIKEIGGWEPISLTRGFTRHISGGGFTNSDHPVQICNPYRNRWADPGTYAEIVRRLGGDERNFSVLRSQDKGAIASLCAELEMPFVPVRPAGDGGSFEATLRIVV